MDTHVPFKNAGCFYAGPAVPSRHHRLRDLDTAMAAVKTRPDQSTSSILGPLPPLLPVFG